jgi:phenylpropionate dioxygenase-like ring-hydroxylating dioxygenase large terminal subunit
MGIGSTTALVGDVDVARRVLAHIDAGTTDEGPAWREPVRNYLDPQRFADELRLLRASPSVYVPSASIPGPGDHLARTAFGVPLFAVRDRDGRARVFRNACRHRAAALIEGSGCARSIVCRYHGWTYRLDGSLSHVPHAEAFPDLDVAERGLVEIPTVEVDGLVVIDAVARCGINDASPDDPLGTFVTDATWPGLLTPELRLTAMTSVVQPINWKVLVEQFLEGYHIRSTHRDTFYPVQYDDLNVVETVGANSRITYPYRNIERLRDRPLSQWSLGHRVTYLHQVFPNVMLATFPDQLVVLVVDPIDIDHSTLTTFVLRDPTGQPRSGADETGEPTLVERGGLEDSAMSRAVQIGLASGANEFVEFGRHESAIGHFHRHLDERLADLRATPVDVGRPR